MKASLTLRLAAVLALADCSGSGVIALVAHAGRVTASRAVPAFALLPTSLDVTHRSALRPSAPDLRVGVPVR